MDSPWNEILAADGESWGQGADAGEFASSPRETFPLEPFRPVAEPGWAIHQGKEGLVEITPRDHVKKLRAARFTGR
jgi:hypothetical protein